MQRLTGGCACHSAACLVQTFLRGVQVVEHDRDALADVAAHVVNLANGGPAGARRRDQGPIRLDGARLVTAVTRIDDLPIRDELRGQSPYGAPQLTCLSIEHQREPVPAPEELVARSPSASPRRPEPQPLP